MTFNEHKIISSIAKESFYEFFCIFWKEVVAEELVPNWHVKYICDELQTVAERVFKREKSEYDLVINVPPGSSKSTICSQMFPAWVWTRFPEAQFICVSYAERISLKDALRMRDIVRSDLYQKCFPHIIMREDLNTKGLFKNTLKGYRLSAGLGGQVMGEHGHFILVDDPLDPEQSHSEAELKAVNRFMTETLPSRKIEKQVTPTILVQQRLHQADPSGEALDPLRKKAVRHICFPGELTDKVAPVEMRKNYKEGLLDPIRMPRKVLDEMKENLGAYGYASQFLQDPVPLGGGMFETPKLLLVDDIEEEIIRFVRSWDKAGTKDGGAYSVGTLLGMGRSGKVWILDVVRGQWSSQKREHMMKQTAEIDGKRVTILLEIEGGSGGKESGENSVRNLIGFKVEVFHPTGDKETRAYPLSSQVGAGNIYVLNRPWTPAFIEEMRFFPYSKFKDQIDSAGAGFNWLASKKPKRKIGGWR